MTRVYFALWGLFALAAAVLFAIGMMTMFTAVIFGTVAFGLTFMGMMGVLPYVVTQEPAPPRPAKKPVAAETAKKVSGAVASFLDAGAVDIRTPRHP
jgi:hypothetical protein